jgi:hypothetical protein
MAAADGILEILCFNVRVTILPISTLFERGIGLIRNLAASVPPVQIDRTAMGPPGKGVYG